MPYAFSLSWSLRAASQAVLLCSVALFSLLYTGCSSSGRSDLSRPAGLLENAGNGQFVPARITAADRRAGVPRCIDLNNYWCIKAPSDRYWQGQIGRDEDGHARFRHPVYAARAFARIMRTYHYRHGLRSPRAIIGRYTPSFDCPNPRFYCPNSRSAAVGTQGERVLHIDNRFAIYRSELPPGYGPDSGCENPVFVCREGYNPNWNYFDYISEKTGVGWDEDLRLFDENQRIDRSRALVIFRAFAQFEISAHYLVERDLILRAITMEERDFF